MFRRTQKPTAEAPTRLRKQSVAHTPEVAHYNLPLTVTPTHDDIFAVYVDLQLANIPYSEGVKIAQATLVAIDKYTLTQEYEVSVNYASDIDEISDFLNKYLATDL